MKDSELDKIIRKVPDFPKAGILFYDITGVLMNPRAFSYCIDRMVELYADMEIDAVAAIEARGFLFAAPYAERVGKPLVLIRKKGKLPGETLTKSFSLEYGTDEIQMHRADVRKGWNVLLVDDLIATGGTLQAAAEMIADAGAGVRDIFAVIGLPFLDYAACLEDYRVQTLIQYHGE